MGNIQPQSYASSPGSVQPNNSVASQLANKMQSAFSGSVANPMAVSNVGNNTANSLLNPLFQVLPVQQPAQPFITAANDLGNAVTGKPLALPAATGVPVSFLDKMSDPNTVDDQYLSWKRGADYDSYLKARKYFVWKSYCNGVVDDWSAYGKWKKIWKEADTEAYRSDYRRWKEMVSATDLGLWKEWLAWKAIKKELQNQYSNKKISKRQLDKMYKEYKRWHRNCNLKSYKLYYKFTKWHEYAGAEWKNLTKYYQWRKNWSYEADCKEWEQKWKSWRRNHNDCDYRNWCDWRQWLMMKGQQTKEQADSNSSESSETKVKDNARSDDHSGHSRDYARNGRYRNYDGYYDHDGNWSFYDHH